MIGTVLLFNPLVPVVLNRSVWQSLDLVAAVVFMVSLTALKGRRKSNSGVLLEPSFAGAPKNSSLTQFHAKREYPRRL